MANPTKPSSLPDAEVNPLLNPLLAKNMGRWAEVYFNAVPEKREEAVHGLLRELQAEEGEQTRRTSSTADRTSFGEDAFGRSGSISENSSSEASISKRLSSEASFSNHVDDRETQNAESNAGSVCTACGHHNRVDQRFCGMCGASLHPQSSVAEPFESRPQRQPELISRDTRLRDDDNRDDSSERTSDYPYSYRREHYADGQYEDDDPNLDHMFELTASRSSSYRIVIAGAVAIIAVVLVYMAWRTGQMKSAWMRLQGETPAATSQQQQTEQNPAGSQNAGTPQSNAPNNTASNNAAANNAAGNAPAQQPQASSPPSQASEEPAPAKTAKRPLVASAKAPATETPAPGVDTGAQELAIAQGYLNGGAGHQIDRAQAAHWLWQAVGKRNLEATLLLSDLYLHGQGVAKNCDQARVLLDAAAVRGSNEAAVRLQHLQAFGCQ